jgi:hypothetical protein
MRRREFIAGLGAAAVWPARTRAQQRQQQMRRIGVFIATPAEDPDTPVRIAGLLQGLQEHRPQMATRTRQAVTTS